MISTFDIANMAIKNACEKSHKIKAVDSEKVDILREYCEAIDGMVDEFGCSAVDVEVFEDGKVEVQMEIGYMTVYNKKHVIYQLMDRASKLILKAIDGEVVGVCFIFPSILKEKEVVNE